MNWQERMDQLKKAREPKPKKVYAGIAKKSAKKIAQEKAEKEAGTDKEMDRWFETRRKELTGLCLFCGGKTERDNDDTYRCSVAHLLEKKKGRFPSVKTHPENSLELCFYGNSCHTNFDNHMIELSDIKETIPKAWEVIISKFLKIYPSISIEERKNIPDILMKYVPKETDMI